MFRPFHFLVLFICCSGLSAEFNILTNEKYPDCGPNEVLNRCVGCPPEDSCYDRNQIICPAAFLPCSAACVCKEGFIRKTLDLECIPKEECGGPCDAFEHYTDCKECSNETCSSIKSPVKCDSKAPCTPGCTCWDGYYKEDKNSACLPRCLCPEMEKSPDCASWNIPFLD